MINRALSLKEWADEDKPREKMILLGKKSLTNAELIAIMLRSGCQGSSVVELSKQVLESTGNSLVDLSRCEVGDLLKFKGLGKTKAITLLAALELGYRMQGEAGATKNCMVHDSRDLFTYISSSLLDLGHEEFWAIFLNNSNRITGRQRIASGGITTTPVDPRMVFRSAIERNAVKIAVAHNHPSGNLKPSKSDMALTKQISEGCNILDLKFLDHLIVGIDHSNKPGYYSFNDNGLL